MSGAFLAGVVAGYGIAVPVGAIGVLIAGLSARTSLRVGAAAGLGAATADGIYALIAVAGGAAVAAMIEPVAVPLRWVGAVVLLALAAWTARGAFRTGAEDISGVRSATALRAYLGVLGLTLLNPATVIYFAALVLGSGGAGGGVWFVVGAFLASASWQLLIAGGGSLVGRVLTGQRGRLITALTSSLVIAVLAVHLLTTG
ncbi:putative LysE-type translocator [Actinoplanes missouriensis 431]|uniref:Putative LysE-type translocator n=1 Tax=Actinoplanes missouriensis (strain ATCC 14538 / DSM 43046 / CBS 188.64 / JCM 3121 / NBRC 102363 / NCIMB 12654 / NRRL B-3342 / UNCC 431) TaxID=512565 RepID=I0H1H0_ACTM4|nr:LysE family transporter [Actinoplanes missouriensis]BAL86857.1 putative LysE-type translocator [Actinoplanes missouriensis 431]